VDAVTYATARAVGLRAKIDREIGYHKTISNVPVPGVNGIISPRTWDLNSADTEMGLINGADVTGLIQRTGFRFWGNRTCSADPRFSFESAVRTNQIIRDIIVDALFPYIDQPLTAGLAAHLIEGINALLRREALAGRIIGGKAFLAAGNTPDQLSAGKLRLGYRFTDAAPLEDLGVESEITDEFYADTFKLAA
jgi:phage tail sheath protein FI